MGQRYANSQDAVRKLAVFAARYTNLAPQLLTESMNHSQRRAEAASKTRRVSHSDKQYVADLEARTYTCGRFETNDAPCGDAVTLTLHASL